MNHTTTGERYPHTILAACCLPWLADETLAEAIFRDSIRVLRRQGLDSLYIFGTAGEGYAVTEAQFDRIASIFVEEMAGAQPMVGVISISLGTMLERIERARAMGVRDFQISLPSWGRLDDQEMKIFFHEVCGRFRDCRFLHYNVTRAGRLVQPCEYAELARKHPNLVASKQSSADTGFITELMQSAPGIRHFFTEPGFATACQWGKAGLLLSLASSNPARARAYFEAGAAGDWEVLMEAQSELMQLNEGLAEAVGRTAHMDGAYDKIFARLHDERFPLALLRPYCGVPLTAFQAYRQLLTNSFPQWLPSKRPLKHASRPLQ